MNKQAKRMTWAANKAAMEENKMNKEDKEKKIKAMEQAMMGSPGMQELMKLVRTGQVTVRMMVIMPKQEEDDEEEEE